MSLIKEMVQWHDFLRFQQRYAAGEFKSQRFGQAFVNEFGIDGDQELFYTESRELSQKIIHQFYLQGNWF